MTKTVEQIIEELKAPFHPEDLQWRIGQAGEKAGGGVWAMVLAYIDDRAIQDRLDYVVGAENWMITYAGMNGDATTATISIKLDGEWISKSNGAGATDIEAIKGGYSGASKRAASVWGIGRYLYSLTDNWATITENKKAFKAKLKGKNGGKDIWYNWTPPELPGWATKEVYTRYTGCLNAIRTATTIEDVDKFTIAAEKIWNPWLESWQREVTGLALKREKELGGK